LKTWSNAIFLSWDDDVIETQDNQVEVKRGRQARNRGASQEANQHIGERIRIRRTLLNLSQQELGKALGMSFQQMRKYEIGTSSVGAGQLCEIAKALDVPVSFFYDGLDGVSALPASDVRPEPEVRELPDDRFTRDEVEVLDHYRSAPGFVKAAIRTLLGQLSGQSPEEERSSTPVSRPRGRPRKTAKAADAAPVRRSSVREADPSNAPAAETSDDGDTRAASATAGPEKKLRRRSYGATWSPSDIRK
jgi:transcriptional regulator with XRE-family HTH domain